MLPRLTIEEPEKSEAEVATELRKAAYRQRQYACTQRWREANKEKLRAERVARYAANKEELKEKRRRYYAENRDKCASQAKARRENAKEQGIVLGRSYQQANRERINAIRNHRRATDPEFKARQIANYHRWLEKNRDKAIAASLKWQAANPELSSAIKAEASARRRARIATSGKVCADIIVLLRRAYKLCPYCNERSPNTLDHIVPIALGGAHAINNLVPACGKCNSSKSTHTLAAFAKRRGFSLEEFWAKRLAAIATVDGS